MILIFGMLYLTGWHTPLIGFLQRGLLATGLIRPNTELTEDTMASNYSEVDLDLTLIDVEGNPVSLQQYAGQVLFINLWASWCPPCLAEMPNIHQLYRELAPEGVVFLMLSAEEDFAKSVAYVKNQGYDFPVYRIGTDWPPELHSSTLPTTFVIDRSGRIVMQHRGMAQYNTQDFKDFLRELL